MRNIFLLLLFSIYLPTSAQDYAQYVNPFIGTGGHGHTFPGATSPFGMVQLSPDTRIDGSWDGCSGYHYSDQKIYGFSHTHLNGTGVSDYGDIMIMPTMGTVKLEPNEYASTFSHAKEKAKAGYYEVLLEKHNILARLTTTPRVGYHEYTFQNSGTANFIIDLNHRDQLLEGEVKIIDSKTIEVFRRSKSWAQNQYVFSRIEFSHPVKIKQYIANDKQTAEHFTGTQLAIALSTSVRTNEKILIKVALSPVSYEGAAKNMKAEATSNDFNQISQQNYDIWNDELKKIGIEGASKDQLSVFYTALYHVFTQPNIAMDVDRKYRGRDNEIHIAEGFDYYSVFSLWDTFRSVHPLMTLIDKKRTSDFINTFIKQYEQGGRLPVWELASNETDCMIGYHSVSVIADAMVKGIKGFDYEKAFQAAKSSAMQNIFGLEAYKQNYVISIDDEHESVSKTLEYAYDDWCIAQMAKLLNHTDDYHYFLKRSESWKNLFNPENGFMQARINGNWYQPFDPREVNNHYTEGNSWQYSFFVPHDVKGLITKHGGTTKFEKFLDQLFNAPEETTGRQQVDITGLIGQYAHGNEPSHHIAYLYNYVDQPQKAEQKIHFILNNFYKNTPDGLIGNEDCGQMSAWYILSSLGIYPVAPGRPYWDTTKPFFPKATLFLEDGSTRVITPESPNVTLQFLGFENIQKTKEETYHQLIASPIISSARIFDFSTEVAIKNVEPNTNVYYRILSDTSINEKTPFKKYKKPFIIYKTSEIEVYAEKGNKKSAINRAMVNKRPNHWSIDITSKPSKQYEAEGKQSLIDGILGTENWRKGNWHGYQGQNFEAIIDLQSPREINKITSRYLQDSRSWILMPKEVSYYASNDGINFILLGKVVNSLDANNDVVQIEPFTLRTLPTEARFIKVEATNYGTLPSWHQGYGSEAFIFIDEIDIQ